jgi:hypothetical protein
MISQQIEIHRRVAVAHAFARPQSIPAQLKDLNAQVASLQRTVLTLQGEVNILRRNPNQQRPGA